MSTSVYIYFNRALKRAAKICVKCYIGKIVLPRLFNVN